MPTALRGHAGHEILSDIVFANLDKAFEIRTICGPYELNIALRKTCLHAQSSPQTNKVGRARNIDCTQAAGMIVGYLGIEKDKSAFAQAPQRGEQGDFGSVAAA